MNIQLDKYTDEEITDLIFRLRNKPGHVTATEKRDLAELLEQHQENRNGHKKHLCKGAK